MPKTKLSQWKRQVVLEWMEKEKLENCKMKKDVIKTLQDLCKQINKVLTKAYPESDMIILKKYGCTTVDYCLKFSCLDGSDVFGIQICYSYQDVCGLQAIPYTSGCSKSKIYEAPKTLKAAIEDYKAQDEKWEAFYKEKMKKYRSFLNVCKYVEDIETAITMPEDLKVRINANNTSLVAINPEIVATIKDDFNGK